MNSMIIKGYIFQLDEMVTTFEQYARFGMHEQKETYEMLKNMRIRLIEEAERAQQLENMRILQEGGNISRPFFKHSSSD